MRQTTQTTVLVVLMVVLPKAGNAQAPGNMPDSFSAVSQQDNQVMQIMCEPILDPDWGGSHGSMYLRDRIRRRTATVMVELKPKESADSVDELAKTFWKAIQATKDRKAFCSSLTSSLKKPTKAPTAERAEHADQTLRAFKELCECTTLACMRRVISHKEAKTNSCIVRFVTLDEYEYELVRPGVWQHIQEIYACKSAQNVMRIERHDGDGPWTLTQVRLGKAEGACTVLEMNKPAVYGNIGDRDGVLRLAMRCDEIVITPHFR